MAVYMLVNGITGSSTESKHIDWIPIKSCTFPVDRPGVNTKPGKISDRLRSAVNFPAITLTKDADKSSPALMTWMVTGATKPVQIAFCKEKGDEILLMSLTDTLLTGLTATVNADEQPSEELKLDFTKIVMKFTTYNKENKFDKAIEVNYNLGTAASD
ncbi:MAG: type VI secretion system tube protein Hcp [Planctomycetota bacterium]|nr:type VI secretion system tube protein Hcp [Planctomycetota bacterium]